MNQGKMVTFNGSKDITQAKHKEPTLCVPPGLGEGEWKNIHISKGENHWNQVNLVIEQLTCEVAFISVLRLFKMLFVNNYWIRLL